MLFCKIYPVIKIRVLSLNFVFIVNNLSRIRIWYYQSCFCRI